MKRSLSDIDFLFCVVFDTSELAEREVDRLASCRC